MREVDREARTVPWQQVAAQLREDIGEGTYAPGRRVPGERELAREWGVNRKTAGKALKALVAEGLLEVDASVGYFVTGGT